MARTVRLFRPAKTAMQSGRAKTRDWVMEFEPTTPRYHDPLMGWVGSVDTLGQVRLRFATREAALAYAKKHGLAVEIMPPQGSTAKPRPYADNFAFNKVG
ncbi:ETC complex I subunit [Roseospirillum parvum]|uniref:ETC complex I subunit conserved region n=1 Tax=Roseospirillum parvum TaxID=83401 RepID=A0A1G8EW00_9PROT|nr:ETC complex I subunit [Roseospirillum parvum]SDH73899.1 ETC complex I subunit conserved region [Roseospirillum parvum]